MQINTYIVDFVLLCIAALMACGILSVFKKKKKAVFITSATILAIIAAISVYLLVTGYSSIVFGLIHIYPFSALFMALFASTMFLVNILAYTRSADYTDLLLLISLSFIGSFIVATAISVLSIFIGLELLAIATSFMILFEGKHRLEAAVKFFILSSVSVAIFAFALALLLPYNVNLTLTPIIQNPDLTGATIALLSMVMFVAVFGFDTALFPFNLWIPDVYQGAPTYVTSMLAGFNKKVAFVALIEVFFFVFMVYKSTFSLIFVILAIITMFFGNLIALVQDNVKRMLAYSSISQAGYILVGIAAATQFGIEASIFYIIAHAFMIIGAFAIVMWLEMKNLNTIEDYTALNTRNSFAAIALTLFMLSMAGIPPLMGFAGKFLLFSSAIGANLVLLAVIGIINSFISIYYYAKVINAMFTKRQAKHLAMGKHIALVVVVCLALIILFGVYPQPLIGVALKASKALFGFI